ncbi:MAG: GWxTD domain-containing protein [Ignavibacteriales bacterium]|nr:MAG: GWxTD domain-containing protein [Ignavibacteriales bacterium]
MFLKIKNIIPAAAVLLILFGDVRPLCANPLYEDSSSAQNQYYQLAVENVNKNTPQSRTLARDYLRKAINSEPGNIQYRLELASLLEDAFSTTAEEEYNGVLSIDSSNTSALLGLAKIREREFYEWLNSVKVFDDNIIIEFNDYAMEDFELAESNYKKVISIDPENYDANIKLAVLYESVDKNDDALKSIQSLELIYPDSFQVFLYKGLILYNLSRIEDANKEFLHAFSLMPYDLKTEYRIKTVSELLDPVLKDKIKNYDISEQQDLFEYYWSISDPLYLTEYNERLTEHYARIITSNLRFTLKNNSKPGWLTDRGEIIMRYGEPQKTMRIRPGVDWGSFNVKTEVWYYKNMVLGFTDTYSSGDYVYNIPSSPIDRVRSQFSGNTFEFVNELKRKYYDSYTPKYEGPSFQVALNTVQFRSEQNKSMTDIYINYEFTDSLSLSSENYLNHERGVFFFNDAFEKVYEKRSSVSSGTYRQNSVNINTAELVLKPGTGNLAFEILRTEDKGVSSNHGGYTVRNFSGKKLSASDLLIAVSVKFDETDKTFIKRKNINLLPSPTLSFSKDDGLYIYYEVYNLTKGNNDYSFEQTFTLKNLSDEEFTVGKIFGSILSFTGLQSDDESVSISSVITSSERDTEIHLQLDLRDYEPGEYELTINLRDINSDDSAETKSRLTIK